MQAARVQVCGRGNREKRSSVRERSEAEDEAGMSNTVKIKNKKKKNELKINYKLWAIVFGVFVALIVAGSVWASFHWGVGIGSIGGDKIAPEDAAAAATEIAASAGTDVIMYTPEDLEKMGLTPDGGAETDAQAEGEADPAAEGAAENAGAEDAAADGAKDAKE